MGVVCDGTARLLILLPFLVPLPCLLGGEAERFDLILGSGGGGLRNVVLPYPSPLSLLSTSAPADTEQERVAEGEEERVGHRERQEQARHAQGDTEQARHAQVMAPHQVSQYLTLLLKYLT